jgi:stalled ribosome rescue protein Dom34
MVQEGHKRNLYEIAGNKVKGERRRRRKNWYIIKEREGEKQNETLEIKVKCEKRKETQRTRVRKTVWAQEGRITGRGSYHRTELGNSNSHYIVGKEVRGKGP